jgi:hypothetical protein
MSHLENPLIPSSRSLIPWIPSSHLESPSIPLSRRKIPLSRCKIPLSRRKIPSSHLESPSIPLSRRKIPLSRRKIPLSQSPWIPLSRRKIPLSRCKSPSSQSPSIPSNRPLIPSSQSPWIPKIRSRTRRRLGFREQRRSRVRYHLSLRLRSLRCRSPTSMLHRCGQRCLMGGRKEYCWSLRGCFHLKILSRLGCRRQCRSRILLPCCQ